MKGIRHRNASFLLPARVLLLSFLVTLSMTVAPLAIVFATVMASAPSVASAAVKVPSGNHYASQPSVPGASLRRTRATGSSFEAKYEKIRDLIASDTRLRGKIAASARAYGIAPIHIVGALVGEHTYNVDAYDRLQSYYVKAISYTSNNFRFSHDGESVDAFIKRPELANCEGLDGSWAKWSCREAVWTEKFRGRRVGGQTFPNNRFSAVFFQPFFAGQTFGLGQLNPLTALKLTDRVNRVSGHRKLDHNRAVEVYEAILDPDITLDYMAAAIQQAIEAYRLIAGFDISGNPGLTATLYNVGQPDVRARALARENRRRAANGQSRRYPRENYYGWLVNNKLDELSVFF